VLLTRGYLLFLLTGSLFSAWAGRALNGHDKTEFISPTETTEVSRSSPAPAIPKHREGPPDTATLVRELIEQTSRNPQNATRIPAWKRIRGFSLEQVQEGLRIAGDPLQLDPPNPVASMLLARWAELDPQPALDSLLSRQGGPNEFTLPSLFNSWMLRDQVAATRWALAHPEAIDSNRLDRVRAAVLLQKPLATACAEARNLPEGIRRQFVMLLARSHAASETGRAECFALLANAGEEDRLLAAETMASAAERRSPRESLDLIEALPFTAVARESARSKSLQACARENIAETVAWLDANPGLGTPGDRGYVLYLWQQGDPDAASDWLARQDRPAALLESAMDQMKLSLSSGYSYAESRARMGERIRANHSRLQAIDPEAAARWLARATPDVAAFVNEPAPDEE
jgi:hypothetical protein